MVGITRSKVVWRHFWPAASDSFWLMLVDSDFQLQRSKDTRQSAKVEHVSKDRWSRTGGDQGHSVSKDRGRWARTGDQGQKVSKDIAWLRKGEQGQKKVSKDSVREMEMWDFLRHGEQEHHGGLEDHLDSWKLSTACGGDEAVLEKVSKGRAFNLGNKVTIFTQSDQHTGLDCSVSCFSCIQQYRKMWISIVVLLDWC